MFSLESYAIFFFFWMFQAELLEMQTKPQEEKADEQDLTLEPKHQSTAQIIYAENRVCMAGVTYFDLLQLFLQDGKKKL